ncbi:VCBS repeat-containing protein [Streptomyces sp. NPDC001941]|uniref:FG-GAP repeat domain-containing protein n=1 Tax=Streptomyces sp. NPDC001941 TaxID=3154659 RepID=UPI00332799C6
MKNSRVIAASLVSTLAVTAWAAPQAAAYTDTYPIVATLGTGTWTTPVALTAAGAGARVVDVRTAGDGTVFALWIRGSGDSAKLEVTVRPAGSGSWGTTRVLSAWPSTSDPVRLVAGSDGSATVAWVDGSVLDPKVHAITYSAQKKTWQSETVLGSYTHTFAGLSLSRNASGRTVAAWGAKGDTDVYKVREAGATTWTAVPAPPQQGVMKWGAETVMEADGTLLRAWSSGRAVYVSRFAPGAAEWTEPNRLFVTENSVEEVNLAIGADGVAALAWRERDGNVGKVRRLHTAFRATADGPWTAPETLPTDNPVSARLGSPVRVLVGPGGVVTLVWIAHDGNQGLQTYTATRTPTDGWSTIRKLSGMVTDGALSASVGADGTVRASWLQSAEYTNTKWTYVTATRTPDGRWTSEKPLGAALAEVPTGAVTTGTGDGATVVWADGGRVWTADNSAATIRATRADKAHDYVNNYDGTGGDVLARKADGSTVLYPSRGGQYNSITLYESIPLGKWPTTSTLIPFGDIDKDGCNDLLVRDAAGDLYRYRAGCGNVPLPQLASTRIGVGWTGMDAFTSPGDLTGDGRADLIARQVATGDLYLYSATSSGTLTRTGRVGTGWKNLTIIGAGDLNEDKAGDVLARDASGNLWRYYGTGKGTIGRGTKLGAGWGGFTSLSAAGDLNGDGHADLVARTKTGDLLRYTGNGKGQFIASLKIGRGWNGFTWIG